MGYQHEYEKRPCKMWIVHTPGIGLPGASSACHFFVNRLVR